MPQKAGAMDKVDQLVDEVFNDAHIHLDTLNHVMPREGEERHAYANGLADGIRYVVEWLYEEGFEPSQVAAILEGQPVAA
jgi:hypothetical protein